ncbi:molybdate-transporting ATPase [Acinetobacter sp. KAM398]|uniref:ATP-binding cassette domain-containing protein n=1 Tax=unclassified Acinetobacter TaxID=196816 RepID=UPI001F3FBDBB|nr:MULTISPECIES: ATP-binding cassette domain-containing protein [unclassified Acinetobacter]GJC32108.1 molybdate-transporting ATPase [Acinetobacter sp. KAM392]GJC34977.1 molybdate-transporting ATPase [Acinetobacter sp. KAM393]GJC37765.1 molybdate-transporting ATPase [Acinetobacter sp. KAM394]GJC40598.1 molybdate-transporting ATPase [Acinetobacter sp. KAM395]GJC43427.1 molybdate-transporting ATPase [Acinetobacter sp. KAM396]
MLKCDFQFNYANFQLQANLDMQTQLIGIVGASGSGKSTFLKNIAGLLKPSHGFIHFQQKILFDHQQKLNIPVHQRKIALIFQQALLFPHLNVMQNLKYAEQLNIKNKNQQKFMFEDIVELLELKPLLRHRAHQLSGGQAQRVSIGRALLSSPDLLLLDEPLNGLDQKLKNQILPFLKIVINQTNLPMIYVTHHIDEVAYLEAQMLHFEKGKIV